MNTITMRRPDDFHIHLRDGEALTRTVTDATTQCARALVMPNLTPALDTLDAVKAYKDRILAHVPFGREFEPLMSLYLSDNLSSETISNASKFGVKAVKWYPKGATTNSEQGVASVAALYPLLEVMQEQGLLLLIHGEVTAENIDIFDREATFIDTVLVPLRRKFPRLKMVLEHITTAHAVAYVKSETTNLAATITAHHLLFNRNHLLVGGIKPHYYCLPILKTEPDRRALVAASISGDKRFFLGTDSAPHHQSAKEHACGCAGCYTGYATMAFYAEVFDRMDALEKLPDFASKFGADYYELPYNQGEIELQKVEQIFPHTLAMGSQSVVPLLAGQRWPWRLNAAS